jgi:heme A synthase
MQPNGDAMKKTTRVVGFIAMQAVLGAYTATAGAPIPVPEPASALALTTGSAAVALYIWWRSRK